MLQPAPPGTIISQAIAANLVAALDTLRLVVGFSADGGSMPSNSVTEHSSETRIPWAWRSPMSG